MCGKHDKKRLSLYGCLLFLTFHMWLTVSVAAAEFPGVDCIVNPNQVVDLSSPVPGVVDRVLVERSQEVKEGQVIALLASSVERVGVSLAKARAQLTPEINASEINVKFDRKRQQRVDSLFGNNVISVQNKEEAERDAQLSVWKLEQAKDLRTVRSLELKRAEALLEQKTIRSTIDGVVVQRFRSQGEYVEDQPIVRIAQLDPLRIDAILPMAYFGQVSPGMSALVYPETIQEGHLATVTVVDPLGDAGSGTFGIRLTMPNPRHLLPAGMKCEMKIMEAKTIEIAALQSMVLASDPDSMTVIDRLRNYEVNGFVLLKRPPFADRVSLGVFSKRENAERRQASIAKLGIKTEIIQVAPEASSQNVWSDMVSEAIDQKPGDIEEKFQVVDKSGG